MNRGEKAAGGKSHPSPLNSPTELASATQSRHHHHPLLLRELPRRPMEPCGRGTSAICPLPSTAGIGREAVALLDDPCQPPPETSELQSPPYTPDREAKPCQRRASPSHMVAIAAWSHSYYEGRKAASLPPLDCRCREKNREREALLAERTPGCSDAGLLGCYGAAAARRDGASHGKGSPSTIVAGASTQTLPLPLPLPVDHRHRGFKLVDGRGEEPKQRSIAVALPCWLSL
nr:hypothetical protein Itr_chr13CG14240 [Ipomoea trifida]